MNKLFLSILICFFITILQSCCMEISSEKYSSSVMDYLYPREQVIVKPSIPTLRLPIKVGIAFVPEKEKAQDRNHFSIEKSSHISETERTQAIELVQKEFEAYDFIHSIQIIPTSYLQAQGGFDNLSQIGEMFDIDVAVLISFDQIQHTRENLGSLTYLTIVGAYVIPGDTNDTYTMTDATVYHIESRKLLFRAPGMSRVQGTSSLLCLEQNRRFDRLQGFQQALQDMIPKLKCELDSFKVKMKEKPEDYQIVCEPGYTGAGSIDLAVLAATLGVLALLCWNRKVWA